jgi:hypothetical protein
MASNHVQHPDQNGNMFGDGPHEPFAYNSIYSHAAPFNTTWAVDPTLQDRSQAFQTTAPPNSAFHPQAWQQQHTATNTPVSASSPAQHHSPYSVPRGYYSNAVSNVATPFQTNSPYAGHGIPQYTQSLDPSLVGRSPAENRTFNQSLPVYSSASPSNTISPSALHSAPPIQGNRQALAGSPVCSLIHLTMPSNHSILTVNFQMGNATREPFRPASANGLPQPQPQPQAQIQLPKAPMGTVSGDFIVTDLDKLSQSTQSVRLHNFINVGTQQYELPITKCKSRSMCIRPTSYQLTPCTATIPHYVPRKSQNELKALAALDPTLRGSFHLPLIALSVLNLHQRKLQRESRSQRS